MDGFHGFGHSIVSASPDKNVSCNAMTLSEREIGLMELWITVGVSGQNVSGRAEC